MILIEAFPVNADMPTDQAKLSTPSDKRGGKPFAGVFAVLTSESSSTQPASWDGKEAHGFGKSDKDVAQLLIDHSPESNLLGVGTIPIFHPESGSQHHDISKGSLEGSGQGLLYAQESMLFLGTDVNVLSQPGLTQEGVYGFANAKDLGKVKELLLRLGLNLGEAEQLIGMESNRLNGKEEATLISKLMNVWQQKGWSDDQLGMTIRDAKSLLAKIGVHIENAGLVVTGGHSSEEDPLKEWMRLLFSKETIHGYGEDTVCLSGKEGLFAQTGNETNPGKGNPDLSSDGRFAIHSIAGREVEGQHKPVEFEPMIFKTEVREPTAQRVVEQIVKGIHVQVRNGQTRARISLHPPSLGELRLSIVTKEDQVRVAFFTETAQAKEIIENNLPQLRESFFQQGLKVEHFNVFVGNHPSGNPDEQQKDFHAIKTSQAVGKGQTTDDALLPEGGKRWMLGNHKVDLFV